MAQWLMKSEPEAYSWADLVREGKTGWNGVRNHQASNNMKAMKTGERAFFYHSVEEKQIVGLMKVSKTYMPDPTDTEGKWGMVEVKPIRAVPRPVTLAAIKAEPRLQNFLLVRQSRLSVVPVGDAEWKILCRMAGLDP